MAHETGPLPPTIIPVAFGTETDTSAIYPKEVEKIPQVVL